MRDRILDNFMAIIASDPDVQNDPNATPEALTALRNQMENKVRADARHGVRECASSSLKSTINFDAEIRTNA